MGGSDAPHWHTGHCGVTSGRPVRGRFCAGREGPLALPSVTRAACISECNACRACRFVSFSQKNKDCSFYRRCDVTQLYTSLFNGASYETAAMGKRRPTAKHSPCATPPDQSALGRAAFVTIVCNSTGRGSNLGSLFGGSDALSPWDNVYQALALGRSLDGVGSAVERVVLGRGLAAPAAAALRRGGWNVVDTTAVPNSAFALRRILGPDDGMRHWPREAGGRYVQRRQDAECTSLKLLVWNLTEYERVMVADTDTCMHEDPAPWIRAQWAEYFVMGREGNFGNRQRGYLGLNSHLFFLQPSALVFRLLTDVATSGSFVPFTNGDQDVLETVFAAHRPMPALPRNVHPAKASSCALKGGHGATTARPCAPAPGTLTTWAERMASGTRLAPARAPISSGAAAAAATPLGRLPPPKWATGFCGVTAERGLGRASGGNCTRGSRGSFTLPESARTSWRAAHAFCAARCLSCGRCAVVSVSLRWVDRWLDLRARSPEDSAPTSRPGLNGS